MQFLDCAKINITIKNFASGVLEKCTLFDAIDKVIEILLVFDHE